MNSIKILIGLIVPMMLGCASHTMQSYVGESMSQIVEAYGMPASVYETGRQNERAFVWVMTTKNVQTSVAPNNPGLYGLIWNAPKLTTGNSVTSTCKYTIYAVHSNTDLPGAEGWTVVGFEKPPLSCE